MKDFAAFELMATGINLLICFLMAELDKCYGEYEFAKTFRAFVAIQISFTVIVAGAMLFFGGY